jgi:hypothetical protein
VENLKDKSHRQKDGMISINTAKLHEQLKL